MSHRFVPLLAVTASLCAPWLVVAQTGAPPVRAHHSLAYDDARQRVILTGGSTPLDGGRNYTFFNDLWEFDGTRWSALPSSGANLSGAKLAFDTKGKRMVSFGGYTGSASIGDLRVLENNVWRTMGQHSEMPAAEPGFVYDTKRGRFIAFGGSAGRGHAHGDTWAFDGERWSRLATTSPPARQAHAMVYDERRGVTVLFGGMARAASGPPQTLGDLWEFDGNTWTQVNATGPLPRNSAGMAYDSKRGLVILFGGGDASGFKGDTWSWDGAVWRKLADTGPDPRAMGYLAYDTRRDRIVLFGGRKGWPNGDLNDTWEWDGSTWRRIEP
jgi:hypothetical protein